MSEHLRASHEKGSDVSREASERAEVLRKQESHVESAEKSENKEREARKEAIELAELSEAKSLEEKVDVIEHEHPDRQRNEGFERTMADVRAELSPMNKVFSNFIHNPAVEKTSDFIGKTVARPDAIASGSLFAFLLVAAVYGIAQYNGFSLSGFETIGAFILGWVIGLIFDAVRALLKK